MTSGTVRTLESRHIKVPQVLHFPDNSIENVPKPIMVLALQVTRVEWLAGNFERIQSGAPVARCTHGGFCAPESAASNEEEVLERLEMWSGVWGK